MSPPGCSPCSPYYPKALSQSLEQSFLLSQELFLQPHSAHCQSIFQLVAYGFHRKEQPETFLEKVCIGYLLWLRHKAKLTNILSIFQNN
jgi:hypothetical protein